MQILIWHHPPIWPLIISQTDKCTVCLISIACCFVESKGCYFNAHSLNVKTIVRTDLYMYLQQRLDSVHIVICKFWKLKSFICTCWTLHWMQAFLLFQQDTSVVSFLMPCAFSYYKPFTLLMLLSCYSQTSFSPQRRTDLLPCILPH